MPDAMTPAERAATAADCIEAMERLDHLVIHRTKILTDERLTSLRQRLHAIYEEYKDG